MLVKIWSVVPTAVPIVKIKDHTLADIDEETNVDATSTESA